MRQENDEPAEAALSLHTRRVTTQPIKIRLGRFKLLNVDHIS